MSLELRQILDVKTPRLSFELLRSEVPARRARHVINTRQSSDTRNGGMKDMKHTAGTCPGGSRTRRRVSQRPTEKRYRACSAEDEALEDSMTAFAQGCEARST